MSFIVVQTTVIPIPGIPQDSDLYYRFGGEFRHHACRTEDELIGAARYADAAIVGAQPYSRRVIEQLERCKIIQTIGIGYEGVDVAAASEHGICVCNVPDYCLDEVSDHAMSLLLACARKILRLSDAVRRGKWDSAGRPEIRALWRPTFRLRGQTLGLVGLGKIPRALVSKAQGFGLRVISYDPYVQSSHTQDLGVQMVEFERLLREADFVSLHAPLTAQTRHMLGAEQFKIMKPTAYVINTARGELIDEQALWQAIDQELIAGAGLDVMADEPPRPDNPLLRSDRVIVTAHSAHYSETSAVELQRRPEHNIFLLLKGEWPQDCVNPRVSEAFLARWGPGPWIRDGR